MRARRRLKPLFKHACRLLLCGLVLAGYLTAVVGLPLPIRPIKDSRRPFPCQSHSCGCLNAEQCWQHCCCYSHEEKVAWASAHDVPPPAPEVELGWRTPRQGEPEAPVTDGSNSLCARPCCQTSGAGCAHESRDRDASSANEPAAEASCAGCSTPPADSGCIVGIQALQCRGLETLWVSSGAVLPPPAAVNWSFEWLTAGWLESAVYRACSRAFSPPDPPPRA